MASMASGAATSLVWTRLLLEAMGKPLNGLFLTFQAIAQLGGLGDFGFSGATGVRLMQHLARGEEAAARRFLANARGVFVVLAVSFLIFFTALSPWLPEMCGLASVAGSGSLPLLFAVGGAGVAFLIINSYLQNLNYISGNVVWPILPTFLLTQIAFAGQWLLARYGFPLWGQYGVHALTALAAAVLAWWLLRMSHTWLGDLWPIRFDVGEVRHLAAGSFWVYLATLGNLLYLTTDRILINVGFGPEAVPAYRYNYRLCELAITLLSTASFVAIPAIVRRLMSSDRQQQSFGLSGVERLQKLQAFGACIAAVTFICFNDLFIRLWLGADFLVPLSWQFAFALNLAIAVSGDMTIQLPGRMDYQGMRIGGCTVAAAGILNFVLSWASMKAGSVLGIALATVVAQSLTCFVMGWQACHRLQLNWRALLVQTWLVPIIAVSTGFVFRSWIAPDSWKHILALTGFCVVVSLTLAPLLHIRKQMFVDEWKRLRTSFG